MATRLRSSAALLAVLLIGASAFVCIGTVEPTAGAVGGATFVTVLVLRILGVLLLGGTALTAMLSQQARASKLAASGQDRPHQIRHAPGVDPGHAAEGASPALQEALIGAGVSLMAMSFSLASLACTEGVANSPSFPASAFAHPECASIVSGGAPLFGVLAPFVAPLIASAAFGTRWLAAAVSGAIPALTTIVVVSITTASAANEAATASAIGTVVGCIVLGVAGVFVARAAERADRNRHAAATASDRRLEAALTGAVPRLVTSEAAQRLADSMRRSPWLFVEIKLDRATGRPERASFASHYAARHILEREPEEIMGAPLLSDEFVEADDVEAVTHAVQLAWLDACSERPRLRRPPQLSNRGRATAAAIAASADGADGALRRPSPAGAAAAAAGGGGGGGSDSEPATTEAAAAAATALAAAAISGRRRGTSRAAGTGDDATGLAGANDSDRSDDEDDDDDDDDAAVAAEAEADAQALLAAAFPHETSADARSPGNVRVEFRFRRDILPAHTGQGVPEREAEASQWVELSGLVLLRRRGHDASLFATIRRLGGPPGLEWGVRGDRPSETARLHAWRQAAVTRALAAGKAAARLEHAKLVKDYAAAKAELRRVRPLAEQAESLRYQLDQKTVADRTSASVMRYRVEELQRLLAAAEQAAAAAAGGAGGGGGGGGGHTAVSSAGRRFPITPQSGAAAGGGGAWFRGGASSGNVPKSIGDVGMTSQIAGRAGFMGPPSHPGVSGGFGGGSLVSMGQLAASRRGGVSEGGTGVSWQLPTGPDGAPVPATGGLLTSPAAFARPPSFIVRRAAALAALVQVSARGASQATLSAVPAHLSAAVAAIASAIAATTAATVVRAIAGADVDATGVGGDWSTSPPLAYAT
ncbi:hypothetical protein FNF27_00378 [Cafeteria roenbergensis]|uniref:Uncharacterized protein n=1 Tax=Cafeteria roenbergensis TaxID=33653 RepID=A0A5A8ER91_CAFRO|nr:hypothetical protein FNF27_00378 [Cafeteria roenbergensis]